MADHLKKRSNEPPAVEPSAALIAVCPYYTMFPLEFPISVMGKFHRQELRVLDPVCGCGTTIFARLKGHQAYGIDCSPIAIAIALAKLAETVGASSDQYRAELLGLK
jgi:hypothetical protein